MYNESEQTRILQLYIVEDLDEDPEPMTKDEQWPFGPFLWSGTSRREVDDYGPY